MTAATDSPVKANGKPVADSENTRIVLQRLEEAQYYGLTVKEIRDRGFLHHGIASGVLSHLHEQGRILMLQQKHNGYHLYVLPEYQNGRDLRPRKTLRTEAYWKREIEKAAAEAYEKGWLQGVDDAQTPVTREPALV